jgi:hypothetical protein
VTRWKAYTVVVLLILFGAGWVFFKHGRSIWVPRLRPWIGYQSIQGVVRSIDATAGARIRASLAQAGVPARPERLWLLAFKDERRMELWASKASGERALVTTWRILGASGASGPKLREGDRQVPEGVYGLGELNPNSNYHLSLRVNYPSDKDRAWAARDGRTRLGGDIFIHGKDVSIGCLAIGDDAVEELFWLSAEVGRGAFTVVIVPTDLRRAPAPKLQVAWAQELYAGLVAELRRFTVRRLSSLARRTDCSARGMVPEVADETHVRSTRGTRQGRVRGGGSSTFSRSRHHPHPEGTRREPCRSGTCARAGFSRGSRRGR